MQFAKGKSGDKLWLCKYIYGGNHGSCQVYAKNWRGAHQKALDHANLLYGFNMWEFEVEVFVLEGHK